MQMQIVPSVLSTSSLRSRFDLMGSRRPPDVGYHGERRGGHPAAPRRFRARTMMLLPGTVVRRIRRRLRSGAGRGRAAVTERAGTGTGRDVGHVEAGAAG